MTLIVSPGELLADRFLIVRFIAEGGMGEVYEADDQVLGERVALKLLSRRAFGEDHVQRRFRREIQLARKVTHANVCRIYDVFQHRPKGGILGGEAVSFVSMELLRGETLEDYLRRRGSLTEEEALPLVRQMANALAAAHAAGVVHRDFKTNNVILVPGPDERVRAVVTDFGLARPIEPSQETSRTPITGESHLIGTAHYIAPEQLYGEDATPRSDIYAFGVVMFEMLTGRKPYSATNPMMLLAKRASEPAPSPREVVPGIDEGWEKAILLCLEDEPENRPATPTEAVAPLLAAGGLLAQSSGTVPRPGLESPARAWWRRPRRIAALLVGVAVAFLMLRSAIRPDASFRTFNPVQVTTSAGLELDPTFSPDGSALAYSSDKSGSFEIWRKDLRPGGKEHQLTEGGDQLFEPAWSPDGQWIAYHSKTRGGIWAVPAVGGPGTRLSEFGSRPAWSPYGERIAFQSESSPQLSDTAAPALALSTLWTVGVGVRSLKVSPPVPQGELQFSSPAPRGALQQLTLAGSPDGGHGSPSFSPDGRQIVFSTSRYGISEIWSIDLETHEASPLVQQRPVEDRGGDQQPETGYDPTYAPDGGHVYFSARDGLWRIPVLPKTGRPAGPPEQIANLGLASIRHLAVSRDGRKLAYATMQTVSNLWSLPLDPANRPGGRPFPLTSGTGRNNRPVFSPDGGRIAFDRWQLGVSIDVWTMTADGGEPTQVTVDPGECAQSSWFPGGDRLAYRAERDGRRGLWAIDLATGAEEAVAELEEDVFWARLSPDGTRLAYHSRVAGGSDDLWVRDLVRGEDRQLTTSSTSMAFPVWSPDGEWLAFQRRQDGDSQVMVIAAAGGEAQALTAEPGQNWPYSFSPDGDKVAFAALRGEEWHLGWVSRTSGEERRLTEPPRLNQYLRYPAWSPAGDRIVYELAQTAGDIYLVEDLSAN